MSEKTNAWNPFLHLAQSVAALLAQGEPLTAKQITHTLRKSGSPRLMASAVSRALHEGAEFHGFTKLPDNRWTIEAESECGS